MLDISDQYVKIKLSNVEDINKTAASDLINLNMFHSKLGRSRSNLGGWQADYTDLKNTWWLQSLDETIKNICLEIINYNNPRAKFNLQLNYWANIITLVIVTLHILTLEQLGLIRYLKMRRWLLIHFR